MTKSKLHRLYEVSPITAEKTQDWPLFVFTEEIAELLANGDSAHKSLEAMIEAGVAHLPYPKMLVQYPCGKHATCIGAVTEHADGEFRATSFFINNEDDTFSLPTGGVTFKFEQGYKVTAGDMIRVHIHSTNDMTEQEQNAYAQHAIIAVRLAVLMSHIGGLEREVIEPEPRLNKARVKRGKPALRSYSYVHVATVYDNAGKAHSRTGTGRHMPVHMRAGHNRRQHYGKENAEVKLIWIPPVLVNYKAGVDDKPKRIEKRVVA